MRKWYCEQAGALVRQAIARLDLAAQTPLPLDSTNRVFLEIEHTPELRRWYDELIEDGRKDTINNTIGWEVVHQTGAKKIGASQKGRSGLIASYGVLQRE
jgi:hypothetical protein